MIEAVESYFGDRTINEIKNAGGGEYDVTVGNKTYTTETITLVPVDLRADYGVTITPSPVYLADGDSVTVELHNPNAGGWGTSRTVSANDAVDVSSSTLVNSGKDMRVTLTAERDFATANGEFITLSWTM